MKRREFVSSTGLFLGGLGVSSVPEASQPGDQGQRASPTAGLVVTFEGLCVLVVTQGLVRVAFPKTLPAGSRHFPVVSVPRKAVINSTIVPVAVTATDAIYPIAGEWSIGTGTGATQALEIAYSELPSNTPTESTWSNLRWALDVRRDLGCSGSLRSDWERDPAILKGRFDLSKGIIEKGMTHSEGGGKVESRKWKLAHGRSRPLKQVVRYRLSGVNKVSLVYRPWDHNDPGSVDLDPTLQLPVHVTSLPEHEKHGAYEPGFELTDVAAYYQLLADGSTCGVLPKAEDGVPIDRTRRSPECSCCPPGVIAS